MFARFLAFVKRNLTAAVEAIHALAAQRALAARRHQIGPGQRSHDRRLIWVKRGGTYKVTHDRRGRPLRVPYECTVAELRASRDTMEFVKRQVPGGGKRERQRRINQMGYVNGVPMHSGQPVIFLK